MSRQAKLEKHCQSCSAFSDWCCYWLCLFCFMPWLPTDTKAQAIAVITITLILLAVTAAWALVLHFSAEAFEGEK
jgi:hypothetical protein